MTIAKNSLTSWKYECSSIWVSAKLMKFTDNLKWCLLHFTESVSILASIISYKVPFKQFPSQVEICGLLLAPLSEDTSHALLCLSLWLQVYFSAAPSLTELELIVIVRKKLSPEWTSALARRATTSRNKGLCSVFTVRKHSDCCV